MDFLFPVSFKEKEDTAISRLGEKKGIRLYCLLVITLIITTSEKNNSSTQKDWSILTVLFMGN